MNFSIGDQVIFINDNLRGKVVGIKKDFLIINCLKLDLEVHKSEVIKISKEMEDIYSKLNIEKDSIISIINDDNYIQNEDKESIIIDIKANISKNFELDLHIEKLIDNFEFLDVQEILQFQMNTFFRGIFEAKNLGIDYLIVIHGIGKGVLKKKIVEFLQENEAIFHDADYNRYKGGAIEIKIN